ncbi:MAG: SRPBCC domain-containing protein [Lewinellaceae bacterium]|nr:SRPBCC domain-containing protein [Lewinella sp.]MCB9281546.1 SRPBCC domain-containing protein [Lewinellaceae bacterium]
MKKVEVRTHIRATPEKVIRAFTDPRMLAAWWGVERALVEERPGGAYTLAWSISDKGFGYVTTGIVAEYDPGRMIRIDRLVYLNPERSFLGPMSLTVEAASAGDLTEVYLCQDGYRSGGDWDWYYEAVRTAWPAVVQTLKSYLESGQIP